MDELGERIMEEFVTLRPKMYSYLTDNGHVDKGLKGTKKVCNKMINYIRGLQNMSGKYQNNFENTAKVYNCMHNVFTLQGNKIVLSANEDNRIQAPNRVTTHRYGCGC